MLFRFCAVGYLISTTWSQDPSTVGEPITRKSELLHLRARNDSRSIGEADRNDLDSAVDHEYLFFPGEVLCRPRLTAN